MSSRLSSIMVSISQGGSSCITTRSWMMILGSLNMVLYLNTIFGICSLFLSLRNKKSHYVNVDDTPLHALLWGVLAYAGMGLTASMQLILGIYKGNSRYVFPFLSLLYNRFILSIATFVGLMVFCILNFPAVTTFLILTISLGILYLQYSWYRKVEIFYYELLSFEFAEQQKLVYCTPENLTEIVLESVKIPY